MGRLAPSILAALIGAAAARNVLGVLMVMVAAMELVPSERAVLTQIRDLFLEASSRTFRLNVLSSRWPPTHYAAYSAGYAGLSSKGLIAKSIDERFFTVTNAGLKAMV